MRGSLSRFVEAAALGACCGLAALAADSESTEVNATNRVILLNPLVGASSALAFKVVITGGAGKSTAHELDFRGKVLPDFAVPPRYEKK